MYFNNREHYCGGRDDFSYVEDQVTQNFHPNEQ